MASIPVATKPDDVFYLTDVVTSTDGKTGVIIEMPDSDSDDDDDEKSNDSPPIGSAWVSWYPDGEEKMISQSDLILKSRVMEPGMGVHRTGDLGNGALLDVSASCTVRLVGTNVTLSNVPGTILTPWNLHYHEPNVVLGNWLGYILQLQQTLVVGLKNGARLKMNFDTARHMEDSKFTEISPFYSGTWYVGQRLEGRAQWFKRATLLSGSMPTFKSLKQKVKGVVLEATLTGIEVEWILCGLLSKEKKEREGAPPSLIKGPDLNKIRVFERHQERFLSIGLPALLKIPPAYTYEELVSALEKSGGVMPEIAKGTWTDTPSHTCPTVTTRSEGSLEESSDAAKLSEKASTDNGDTETGPNSEFMSEGATEQSDLISEPSGPLSEGVEPSDPMVSEGAEPSDPMVSETSDPFSEGGITTTEEFSEGGLVCGTPKVEEEDGVVGSEIIEEGMEQSTAEKGTTESEDSMSEEEDEESGEDSDSGLDDSIEPRTTEGEGGGGAPAPTGEEEEGEEETGGETALMVPVWAGGRRRKSKKGTANSSNGSSGWCSKITPKGPIEIGGQYLVEVVDACYTGRVLWEDGRVECVPCTQLNQIDHLDDHAHLPGYFVNRISATDRLAVVTKYSSSARTCNVYWLDTETEECDVSVYSLEYNKKYDFNPMDIILSLVECSHSTIGQVVTITPTGKLLVSWADGVLSSIAHDACIHLQTSPDYDDITDDEEGDEDYALAEEGASETSSWMTADSDFFSEHGEELLVDVPEELPTEGLPTEEQSAEKTENPESETVPGDSPTMDPYQYDALLRRCQQEGSGEDRGLWRDAAVATVLAALEQGHTVELSSPTEPSTATEMDSTTAATATTEEGSTTATAAEEGSTTTAEEAAQTEETDASTTTTTRSPRKRFLIRNSRGSSLGSGSQSQSPPEFCEPQEVSAAVLEHANIISESFKTLPECPSTHQFHGNSCPGSFQKSFLSALREDIKMISQNLPPGIWVRAFEDRINLLSCLIEGPRDTPYEGVLFAFDIVLPSNYRHSPPNLHYVSYSQTKLNPNLYPSGKVCLSLVGTWVGKGTETWTETSSLLQLLISIQGLVLNSTPYYNEAGFNKYKETQGGELNSKHYNEMIILKINEHTSQMYMRPHEAFREEIISYYSHQIPHTIKKYESFIKCSEEGRCEEIGITYPLLPLSKGVMDCLRSALLPLHAILMSRDVYSVPAEREVGESEPSGEGKSEPSGEVKSDSGEIKSDSGAVKSNSGSGEVTSDSKELSCESKEVINSQVSDSVQKNADDGQPSSSEFYV